MSRSDAIVPLQVDAASGPEEVISEKALETGSSLAGQRTRGATSAAVRCFGSLWL